MGEKEVDDCRRKRSGAKCKGHQSVEESSMNCTSGSTFDFGRWHVGCSYGGFSERHDSFGSLNGTLCKSLSKIFETTLDDQPFSVVERFARRGKVTSKCSSPAVRMTCSPVS